jgi:hypothetical protein
MIRSLEVAIGDSDPDDLGYLVALQLQLGDALSAAVYRQRDHGISDADIAAALGITRQAVSKRWPGGGRYVGAAGRYRQSQPHQEAKQCS